MIKTIKGVIFMITVLGINKDSKGNITGYKCSYDGKVQRILTPQQLLKKIADGEVSNATSNINVSLTNIKLSMSGFNAAVAADLEQQKQAANFAAEYTKCVNDYNVFVNFLKVFWEANGRLTNDFKLFNTMRNIKPFFVKYMQSYELDHECTYYINDLKGYKYLDLSVSRCGFIYELLPFCVTIQPLGPYFYRSFYVRSYNSSFICEVPFNEIPTMDWFVGKYSDERFVAMVHKLNAIHFLDMLNKFERYFNDSIEQFLFPKFC